VSSKHFKEAGGDRYRLRFDRNLSVFCEHDSSHSYRPNLIFMKFGE